MFFFHSTNNGNAELYSENDSGSDIYCSKLDSSLDSEVISCPVECTAACCCDLKAIVAAGLPYQVKLKHVLDHIKKTQGDKLRQFYTICTEHILGLYFAPQPSNFFSASTVQLRVHEQFRKHASSSCHRESVMKLDQMRFPGVDAQHSKQLKSEQQQQHRRILMIQLHSMCFLLCQGLAVRGHDQEEGNLFQLLKLHSADHGELNSWLKDKNYLSSEIMNEMVALMSQHVTLQLWENVHKASIY